MRARRAYTNRTYFAKTLRAVIDKNGVEETTPK